MLASSSVAQPSNLLPSLNRQCFSHISYWLACANAHTSLRMPILLPRTPFSDWLSFYSSFKTQHEDQPYSLNKPLQTISSTSVYAIELLAFCIFNTVFVYTSACPVWGQRLILLIPYSGTVRWKKPESNILLLKLEWELEGISPVQQILFL